MAPAVIAHLAGQIGIGVDALDGYAWASRSGRRHRVIIDHLAVVAFDEAAEARFRRWLADDALPREFSLATLEEELSGWFARSRVTRPGAYRINRKRDKNPCGPRDFASATRLVLNPCGSTISARPGCAIFRLTSVPEKPLWSQYTLSKLLAHKKVVWQRPAPSRINAIESMG